MGDLPPGRPEPEPLLESEPEPLPPDEVEPPTYVRPWFVASVVAGCAALAGLIFWLGSTDDVVVDAGGDAAPAFDPGAAEAAESPEPARREDCPDPGARVNHDAAELVLLFGANATGGGFGSLPASEEVQEQLEAGLPAPAVNRMTRIRGWTGAEDTWSTCVLSSWVGPDGPMQSIDIVTASVVPGDERSDAGGDEDGSSRRDDDLDPRWEITAWIRGVPEEPPPSRAATVEFYNSKRACRRPDRPASVPIPDASPSQRLVLVMEELASGTPSRANSAATRVPADLQVLEASVDDGRARVVLTPTGGEMSRCEGTAAYEQVRDTAAAVAAETIPAGDDRDPEVEVVIEGEGVDTLRR